MTASRIASLASSRAAASARKKAAWATHYTMTPEQRITLEAFANWGTWGDGRGLPTGTIVPLAEAGWLELRAGSTMLATLVRITPAGRAALRELAPSETLALERYGAGQGEGGGGWEPRCERCDHQRTAHAGDSGPCDASMCSCLEFQPSPAPETRR